MSTHFFENQERARKMTSRLVLLYGLAVLGIVGSVVGLVHIVFGVQQNYNAYDVYGNAMAQSLGAQVYILVALATLAVIAGGMFFRMWQLSRGGAAVAELLGGTRIDPNTKNFKERRLLNVVEEMAIASGIAVPPVYVLATEDAINAFAAGEDPSHAVIGVTRGTLNKLSRDELQGVIAHEFSHVFNGDMKLNLRLIGVLSGITFLFTIGRILLRAGGSGGRRSSRKGGGGAAGIMFFALGLLIIGGIGVFFARLIKAAVSRQREYLADASAVQYTRNPEGISRALLKIDVDSIHGHIRNSYAEEASHLFFGQALKFSSLFATHPPIKERVRRINPRASLEDSEVLKLINKEQQEPMDEPLSTDQSPSRETHAGRTVAGIAGAGVLLGGGQHRMMQSIGEPTAEDLSAAQEFLAALPAIAVEASKTAEGAKALLLSLLLYESEVVERQKVLIVNSVGAHVAGYVDAIKDQLGELEAGARLAILQKSVPPLRELNKKDIGAFLELVKGVIRADQKYHIFEYVVLTFLSHQLLPKKPSLTGERSLSLGHVRHEVSVLISAIAHVGATGESQAKEAFQAARRHINSLSIDAKFLEAKDCGAEQLESALARLSRLKPLPKQSLIEACINAILCDRKVAPEEIELLQAVSMVLGIPMPPVSSLR